MEIKDVFGAQPRSVWEFLCENGQGLYIPAYQRQYSWDKQKIGRLFEDSCHGFSLLVGRDDALTFLGTIIAIHDTQLLTVQPIVRGDVPAKVMTIIDGQQRLTTLLLINTVLHEELRVRSKKLEKSSLSDDMWLLKECKKTIGRLGKTFEEDKDYGDDDCRYYPRMIRSYEDSWSREKDKACYQSAIGRYLHQYGSFCRAQRDLPFKYESQPSTQRFADNRTAIIRLIRVIAKGGDKDLDVPSLGQICDSADFQQTLTKATFPDDIIQTLQADERDDFKELFRLVLFANFVLDRVAITIVTARNEDYAFDMFEALNTTGEPLTAFETFKPRVILSENLGGYEKSKSREYVDAIEGYLESFDRSTDKQDATSKLIIAFALAEVGSKESKRLSDQRRFLRDTFDKLAEDIEEQRAYVRHLSHAAQFLQYAWPDSKDAVSRVHLAAEAQTDEVTLCFDVLRQLNHAITQGPLIRYYSALLQADTTARPASVANFVEAVKSITAFSIIWRSSRRTTDNIDAVYRDLMREGCPAVGMQPLARRRKDFFPAPADELKLALKQYLATKGGITSKDDWVKLASKLPAYANQTVARFILLAAAHDSIDDSTKPGLTKSAKSGWLQMLRLKTWREAKTIEHIAPQGRSNDWEASLYADGETVDKLGNLTILPQSENSSLSNHSWAKKKLYYSILSAPTEDALKPLIEQAKAVGIEISQSNQELLERSAFLPWVKAVSNVQDGWTVDLIEARSINIAEQAWDRIAPWLGLE